MQADELCGCLIINHAHIANALVADGDQHYSIVDGHAIQWLGIRQSEGRTVDYPFELYAIRELKYFDVGVLGSWVQQVTIMDEYSHSLSSLV